MHFICTKNWALNIVLIFAALVLRMLMLVSSFNYGAKFALNFMQIGQRQHQKSAFPTLLHCKMLTLKSKSVQLGQYQKINCCKLKEKNLLTFKRKTKYCQNNIIYKRTFIHCKTFRYPSLLNSKILTFLYHILNVLFAV